MSEHDVTRPPEFACVGCALCDVTHGEKHVDGETLTDTFNRAWRVAVLERGFCELGLRDGRLNRRLVCGRCTGDVARVAAAPAPTRNPMSARPVVG